MADFIYLDYNATTPIAPAVAEAMMPFLHGGFGNPSSAYGAGVAARQAMETARKARRQVETDPYASYTERAEWEMRISQIAHVIQLIDFIIAEMGYTTASPVAPEATAEPKPSPDDRPESVNDLAEQLKDFIKALR